MRNKFWIVLCLAGIFCGCYNDKYNKLYPATTTTTTTCDTTTIAYTKDIKPIIVANCYSPGNGCHDAAGSATSGFDYQTSATVLISNATSGLLLADITWQPRHNQMPKGGAMLPGCDIAKITRWVNEGAPNN
jgi:hypothetical protein